MSDGFMGRSKADGLCQCGEERAEGRQGRGRTPESEERAKSDQGNRVPPRLPGGGGKGPGPPFHVG